MDSWDFSMLPARMHALAAKWHVPLVCHVCNASFILASCAGSVRPCRAHLAQFDSISRRYRCCDAELTDAPGCAAAYHRASATELQRHCDIAPFIRPYTHCDVRAYPESAFIVVPRAFDECGVLTARIHTKEDHRALLVVPSQLDKDTAIPFKTALRANGIVYTVALHVGRWDQLNAILDLTDADGVLARADRADGYESDSGEIWDYIESSGEKSGGGGGEDQRDAQKEGDMAMVHGKYCAERDTAVYIVPLFALVPPL